MTQFEFKTLLKESTVTKFIYRKKDGTERYALGTLNEKLLPEKEQLNPEQPIKIRQLNPEIIRYFDLDKNGYRSFNFEKQFIGLA